MSHRKPDNFRPLVFECGPQKLLIWDVATHCPECGCHSRGFGKLEKQDWTKHGWVHKHKVYWYHETPDRHCMSIIDHGWPFWTTYIMPNMIDFVRSGYRIHLQSHAFSKPCSVEQPVATVLMDLIHSYEEHKLASTGIREDQLASTGIREDQPFESQARGFKHDHHKKYSIPQTVPERCGAFSEAAGRQTGFQ